jgi:hypothetical protein
MEHDKLLAEIDKRASFINADDVYEACRAVVELHKPIKDEWIEYTTCKACRVGDDDYYSPVYPCPTIQAIYKELK